MNFLKVLILSLSLFLVSNNSFSQCFQIESILVDACDNGSDEGFNEMFRMKIGPAPLNTSSLSINWPAQAWLNLVQNATTASKVSQLNTAIAAAGGCGQILEPTGGVLPANATVIVVTSPNLDTTLNSFGALTSDIYMLFQNTPSNPNAGHFGNYNATPATRTLSVSFGGGCTDSVTYQRANLVNSVGGVGGTISDLNGSTVNFTPSGTASYVNNGCIAPVPPFTIEAGTTPIASCAGQTINLSGAAQGQTSVTWSAASGSFSTPNNLSTTYTIPTTATAGSSITLTLSATNSCGTTITDQITINISGSTLTLDSSNNNQDICSGNTIAPIQYTFGGGVTSVNVTGLPTGVTATTSGNTVTISGIPTSPFSYTVDTIGGCGIVRLVGSITFSTNATLTLDSANNNQDICSGNAITPIQYTFGGGVTSVNVIGLPTGVTATTSGNTVTISGTPTSGFSYSINTIGGCGTVPLGGSITFSTNATLTLDSANNNQDICSGNAIAPIQYTFGGGVTSVNVTGLPTGVTATTSGNTVTISGTPTNPFSYNINTIGGCGTVLLGGSITFSTNATLTLDSANNTQSICSGNAIAPIQYTFGGGATNVNVTGLPTGVTATTSGNTVTISGTPTSPFSYNINTIGGCGTVLLGGSITFSTNATLTLDSANNTQSICSGNAIAPIQYTFGGGATNVNVTGLPTGVTATTSGNTVTISGTPANPFSYNVNTIGGCGTVTLNGTVSVSSNATLTLDSANNTQSICSGNAIAPIQYTFGGGATNVNVTGIPTGVTATTSGNTVTISGTPASPFSYNVNTIGGCGTVLLGGSITFSTSATLTLDSANNTQSICSGNAIAPIQYTFGGGATNVNVTGLPTGVTATTSGNTVTISGTPANPFSYNVNTIGGCGTVTLNGTVSVSSNATLTLDSANNTQSICSGNTITPIQYTFGGGATSVNVTGLPTGVTATTSGNTVTISGTPASGFSYSINTVGGCGTVTLGGSITLSASGITPTFNAIAPICEGTSNSPLPATSINGITGTWSPNFNNTTTQTYTFTPNPGQCASSTSLTVQITPKPILTYTVTNSICDGNPLDFVLSSNVPGTTYTWSATLSNITGTYVTSGNESNINQIATLDNSETVGTVTVKITPHANGCSGDESNPITIFVNPNPVVEAVAVADTSVCSATNGVNNVHVELSGNISGITYNWTAITSGVTVVGGTTSGTITATATTTSFDLQVITSDPLVAGTIYFDVSTIRNGCPGNTLQSLVVTVNPNPGTAIPSPDKTICSGEPTGLMIDVSPLIAGTEIEWEVLTVFNVTGANPGSGIAPQPINDILTSTQGGYVIYRVRTSLGECEGSYTDYRVNVNPAPLPILTDGNICITATGEVYQTYTLNTGLNDADYDFEWYDSTGTIIPGETNATLVVDEAGTYSVIATNWLTGCSSDPLLPTSTATVSETMTATSMTVVQSEYFSDNATITVTVPDGTGTLMYSLDEGPLQSSNVFTGVSAGEHTVTVVDTEGCTYMTQDVTIIDYPNYFTPNGDGINDTWNISGLNQADAKLYIFDRYGKLLKQLSATEDSNGWDGTYNQELLPSTDYWFSLDYTENGVAKQFKAHFSLKR